ncbi:Sas10 C-terminal domain-containing protein [Trametes polyzona]|nr:Sas10 C-terminal domain-containing protein [Trametes polyzona]
MVRRRSGKGKAAHSKARGVDRKDSKINKWNRAEDIPMDEEDQFHASRDKILLEGDQDGGSDDGDEDEVFALKGVGESESEDEDEGGDYDEDEDDIDEAHYAAAEAAQKAKKKAKGKGKKGKQDASDEESESESESEEEEGWGTKKSAYYSSNAQEIDSEDEEAIELEEQEAKRLQTKARDAMADDDFGLADVAEGLPEAEGALDEPTQPALQPLPQDKQSLLRHLEKTNPEALALANDWDDVAHSLVKAQAKIAKLEAEDPTALGLSMMHLHHQALLTYATTLAFYLHLRTSEKYVQRPDLLRAHPILPRLLKLKQSLSTLEDLDFAASDDDESDISGLSDSDLGSEDGESAMDSDDLMADAQALWAGNKLKKKGKGLEQGELEDLLRDAHAAMDVDASDKPKKAKRKQKAAAEEPPKKKRKAADARAEPVIPVFDLVEPELGEPSSSSSKLKSKAKAKASPSTIASADDVYGEASALDVADAADKQARKKSLRFHVARIESTAARRAGARAGAVGGDDDIPYRERKREKEARLAREVAKARDAAAAGADLDDADPEAEAEAALGGGKKAKKRRREESESGSDAEAEDGYYALVQRKSKEKKEKKKQEYEAARAAERYVEEEGVDGPRSLTRAILKNKGLTPKRSKSVRNPRVKKRQKYEKAKKKVASQKAVYKGGMDASRYAGEKTGISQTVKGVRL